MSEKNKYVRCKASGQIKRIAYISKEGDVCLESKLGNLHIIGALGFARDCEHLSDCDSFDWQPETFPQWYSHGLTGSRAGGVAYIQRCSATEYECVTFDGKRERYTWVDELDDRLRLGTWTVITQAEAESRVKKPEPVESPDDWVEFDGGLVAFPLHKIDELKHATESSVEPAIQAWHGKPQQWQASIVNYKIRCRRRDLPPIPRETPKREYVRCFTTLEGTVRTAKDISEFDMPKLWYELKHDGTGFYLEDVE